MWGAMGAHLGSGADVYVLGAALCPDEKGSPGSPGSRDELKEPPEREHLRLRVDVTHIGVLATRGERWQSWDCQGAIQTGSDLRPQWRCIRGTSWIHRRSGDRPDPWGLYDGDALGRC